MSDKFQPPQTDRPGVRDDDEAKRAGRADEREVEGHRFNDFVEKVGEKPKQG